MNATHALIQSDRFPCVWSEQPDADPPPGREFAQALLEVFTARGASPHKSGIGDRDWEHSSWFFRVTWQGDGYQIFLEPSPHDTTSPTWHLKMGFTTAHGQSQLLALFWSRKRKDANTEAFRRLTAEVLQHVAGCGTVAWITEDQAIEALWGAPPKR